MLQRKTINYNGYLLMDRRYTIFSKRTHSSADSSEINSGYLKSLKLYKKTHDKRRDKPNGHKLIMSILKLEEEERIKETATSDVVLSIDEKKLVSRKNVAKTIFSIYQFRSP